MISETTTLYERMGSRPQLDILLKHFYADVRQHHEIGPIFNRQVHDWPAHLDKIAGFWSGITGGPILYKGGMPWKHVALGLEEKHFAAWLGLWHRNCRIHLAAAEAEEMIGLAENIGQRLRMILRVAQESTQSE